MPLVLVKNGRKKIANCLTKYKVERNTGEILL